MMEYERLTKRGELNGNPYADECCTCYDDICSTCPTNNAVWERLAELEDKIEQGTLKEIPENAVVLTEEEYERWQGQTLNIKKVRKETAEKFAELAKARLNEWLEDNEDNDGKIDFGIANIELIGVKSLDGEIIAESLIDEIAKEITEGKE